jgi:hypothetical protein
MAKKAEKPAGAANTERALEPSARKPGWRDQGLKVHPLCEKFDPLPRAELIALGEDIKQNRLQERIKLIRDGDGYTVIDGRSRLDAMEAVGLSINVFDGRAPNNKFFEVVEVDDPAPCIASANIYRRHLAPERRIELLREIIKANPTASSRQIAKDTGYSPTKVVQERNKLEQSGDVSTVDTRTDTRGRRQPARKPLTDEQRRDRWLNDQRRERENAPPVPVTAPTPEQTSPPTTPSTVTVSADDILEIAFRVRASTRHGDTITLCDWAIQVAQQIVAAAKKTGGGR